MRKVFTVTEINRYIRSLFRNDPLLGTVSVKGEVRDCRYHGTGHIFFQLKDAGGLLPCVMFAGDRARLTFRLADGMQVTVRGTVDVFERDGRYQLYAKEIARAGEGALYERFLKLKAHLEEEGLFAEEYKLPLPPYAQTIGIVTAPGGAAIRDIITVARRRNPYVNLVLYPALVQGEGAVPDIVNGIAALEAYGTDVIIVGRGGGSIEDLWAFNEEAVARAIFHCTVPVVSAVGHETDVTIADFVADLRAPTPSAAAELTVFEFTRFEKMLDAYRAALTDAVRIKLTDAKQTLQNCQKSLAHLSPQARVSDLRLRNSIREKKLYTLMRTDLADAKRRVVNAEMSLETEMDARLTKTRHALALCSERLNGLSPLQRLSAGYGFLTGKDGKRVTEARQVSAGDRIDIFLADGKIGADVTAVTDYGYGKGTDTDG